MNFLISNVAVETDVGARSDEETRYKVCHQKEDNQDYSSKVLILYIYRVLKMDYYYENKICLWCFYPCRVSKVINIITNYSTCSRVIYFLTEIIFFRIPGCRIFDKCLFIFGILLTQYVLLVLLTSLTPLLKFLKIFHLHIYLLLLHIIYR